LALMAASLAVQLKKLTLPKLASGKTPPAPEGASAIHSAEPSRAYFNVCWALKLHCRVASLMVSAKLPAHGGSSAALAREQPAASGWCSVLSAYSNGHLKQPPDPLAAELCVMNSGGLSATRARLSAATWTSGAPVRHRGR
jgi:hypothetical protein